MTAMYRGWQGLHLGLCAGAVLFIAWGLFGGGGQ